MTAAQFGWLDTTIFVHALFQNDPHRQRCLDILQRLEKGEAEAWIDDIVIHELTYVLPRALPRAFTDRAAVAEYLLAFLALDNIRAMHKDVLVETLQHWSAHGVSFADARLAVLARRHQLPVCTVNKRDFMDVKQSF